MSNPTSIGQVLANSSSLTDSKLIANSKLNGYTVGEFLKENADVVDKSWEQRHAKLIYKIGFRRYSIMASKARVKNDPKAYMGFLVNLKLKEV